MAEEQKLETLEQFEIAGSGNLPDGRKMPPLVFKRVKDVKVPTFEADLSIPPLPKVASSALVSQPQEP